MAAYGIRRMRRKQLAKLAAENQGAPEGDSEKEVSPEGEKAPPGKPEGDGKEPKAKEKPKAPKKGKKGKGKEVIAEGESLDKQTDPIDEDEPEGDGKGPEAEAKPAEPAETPAQS